MRGPILELLVVLLLASSCAHENSLRTTDAASASGGRERRSASPTVADDGIKRWPASVAGNGIRIRLARTRAQHFRGLAGVRLQKNEGMFFMYGTKVRKSFWMKGCIIGLDIAWLSDDLRVLKLDSLDAPTPGMREDDIPSAMAPTEIRYVLEMPKGWFASRGLGVGSQVSVADAVLRMKAE